MRQAGYVRGALGRFGANQGLGGEPAVCAEVIEAFCVIGLADRASSTRGTYRSVLRRLGPVKRPVGARPFAGAPAAVPYTAGERAELMSMAFCQRAGWRRESALVFLGLGIGAGLRPGELVAVRGGDVAGGPGGVKVTVRAALPRVVEVRQPWAALVADRGGGEGFLFHPAEADRGYPNFVNDFARRLVADAGSPKLSSSRCRASFICDHLAAGSELAVVLDQTGIVEVESLLRYARHVATAPRSKAELRRQLRDQ